MSINAIDQNLILTGYLGPGQLIIARQVAERLRMPFVDFELVLEDRAGLSGEDLRIRFGEARLKTLESELVDEVALYRGTVIHISGKTLQQSSHYARLSETGPVICLVATLDAVLRRSASGAGRALPRSLRARHRPRHAAPRVGDPPARRDRRDRHLVSQRRSDGRSRRLDVARTDRRPRLARAVSSRTWILTKIDSGFGGIPIL